MLNDKANKINYRFMKCFVVIILLFSTFNTFAQQDKKPFKAISLMPLPFQNQIKSVNREVFIALGMRFDSSYRTMRNYTTDSIDRIIYHEKDYELLFRTPFWMAMDSARYCYWIPKLIKSLTDTTTIGLTNAGDVTIWCRVKTKELVANSLNYQIDDDAFRVCGRAHWILKRLTKNEFGNIRCDTSMEDIELIQKQWYKWLSTLKATLPPKK